MKAIIILLMIFAPLVESCAQLRPKSGVENAQQLGWDLTYQSVLDANSVGQDEWIRKWLGPNYESPVKKLIVNWNDEPIQSSVLIEYPGLYAGEKIMQWFVRTKNRACYYERVPLNPLDNDDKPPRETNESLDPLAYDKFFAVVSTWQQAKPVTSEGAPDGAIPGYKGFFSLYNSGNSRQMLLTVEDFSICETKNCETWKPGRLGQALKVIPRFNVQPYKHKAETEIAAMTPAERVDEYANEETHPKYKYPDEQRDLIVKYLRRDGLKAMPRMVEIMDEYDPATESGRSGKKAERFSAMSMLLSDLDSRAVRLRGTTEGRQAMDALARGIARIGAAWPGKKDQHEWPEHGRFEGAKMDFESAKGINITDEAIKDTLWVKYRIKISDKELLAFTNYLIGRDPTYPSWSEIEGDIEDYSRLNKEGYPARVNIMKQPARFHQAYLEFKKSKR